MHRSSPPRSRDTATDRVHHGGAENHSDGIHRGGAENHPDGIHHGGASHRGSRRRNLGRRPNRVHRGEFTREFTAGERRVNQVGFTTEERRITRMRFTTEEHPTEGQDGATSAGAPIGFTAESSPGNSPRGSGESIRWDSPRRSGESHGCDSPQSDRGTTTERQSGRPAATTDRVDGEGNRARKQTWGHHRTLSRVPEVWIHRGATERPRPNVTTADALSFRGRLADDHVRTLQGQEQRGRRHHRLRFHRLRAQVIRTRSDRDLPVKRPAPAVHSFGTANAASFLRFWLDQREGRPPLLSAVEARPPARLR